MFKWKGNKFLALAVAAVITVSPLVPMTTPFGTVYADTVKPVIANMDVSNHLLSMTETREIKVTAKFKTAVNPANITWSFGGKGFSEWKKWNADSKSFTGEPYVSLVGTPTVSGTELNAVVKFDMPFGSSDLLENRLDYPALLGTYDLKLADSSSGEIISYPLKLNAYDAYTPYSEFKTTLEQIQKNAQNGRYVEVSSLGKSSDGGREQYFVVVAKNKAVVDDYLKNQVPQMLNNPAALQQKLKTTAGAKAYKSVIWFNNVHPDEAVGPDANIQLARDFATKTSLKFDLKKALVSADYPRSTEMKVDSVLEDFILVFNITQNPYGREMNRRVNVNNIDLNRDYTYQTQLEAQNFAKAFTKWAPLSMIDFHGFYPQFLIEPCTGPHNPNFEFDLMIDGLVGQAYAVGKVGTANTKYLSSDIPYLDYKDGFDDATPCYTSTYALMQDSLGITVEIPELNQDSFNACVYGGYGAINYLKDRKVRLANTQLEAFRRGVENIDSRENDRFLINGAGTVIGRDRGNHANYFPEYYVLPMDKTHQKNTYEATNTVNLLLRSGVKVNQLTKATKVGDETFAAGSYVVSMHQAHRSFANVVLSKGIDASDWGAMYAEIVNAFSLVRGFDVKEIRTANAFTTNLKAVYAAKHLVTQVPSLSGEYVVKNDSNQAPKIVNELLAKGKLVKQVTKVGNGYQIGDFIVSAKDLKPLALHYDLTLNLAKAPYVSKNMKKVAVYVVKSTSAKSDAAQTNDTGLALTEMGFHVVADLKAADVVVDSVGAGDEAVINWIKAGKPYVAIGKDGMQFLTENKLLANFEFANKDMYYEGLYKAHMTPNLAITNGYGKEEMLYSASGSFMTKYPRDAVILERVLNQNDFFVSGWWPNHAELKNQVVGIQKDHIVIFANDLTNKAHPTAQFRLLANTLFGF